MKTVLQSGFSLHSLSEISKMKQHSRAMYAKLKSSPFMSTLDALLLLCLRMSRVSTGVARMFNTSPATLTATWDEDLMHSRPVNCSKQMLAHACRCSTGIN